ncbi:hypothetical protein PQX77_004955 [Marasmius sp. AFHP31]|nr:hypothetical protein PQX77_004955 [Marasmius sp. AFHP31]
MSQNTNLNTAAMRPEHQLHNSSQPLPGAGGNHNIDYSAQNIERSGPDSVWNERDERQFASDQTHTGSHLPKDESQFTSGRTGHTDTTGHSDATGHTGTHSTGHHDTSGKNAFNSDRPMNVQPTEAGGVAVGGRSDLPEGRATATDKLVGKTQKVIGKMTHNAEMHEKGELRESGGKAAAQGAARAPHD